MTTALAIILYYSISCCETSLSLEINKRSSLRLTCTDEQVCLSFVY